MKHIHILGIGGTFMSGLAILAREAGYQVTGSDEHCYPPVSDLLRDKGIDWVEGYRDCEFALNADVVIVGNAIKRGMPVLEAILEKRKDYTSGPQWLAEHILPRYNVIAVAGTHGKTTTSSMLAHIFSYAGMQPGFLIGGVPSGFQTSAKLGKGKWFIIEADEYDSAFFDKRPKFMHYRPGIAILNNLEFDHADIYADLEAIQQQFYYLLRTIPANGTVIKPKEDRALNEVCEKGPFSLIEEYSLNSDNTDWYAQLLDEAGSSFNVLHTGNPIGSVQWNLLGKFNVENGLAAIAASACAGVELNQVFRALESFTPVKRRLELKAKINGVTIYDDFAHHPTAIANTIKALKLSKRHSRILGVMEFASYTMRKGIHAAKVGDALANADYAYVRKPDGFLIDDLTDQWHFSFQIESSVDEIVKAVSNEAHKGDAILIMSNRGFDNIQDKIVKQMKLNYA